MKTIGLIGGTSWVSTIEYYKLINQLINERLGNLNSAKIILYSLNFEEFKNLADNNNWKQIADNLTAFAQCVEHAGAECILLCANTTHMVADIVQQNIQIPLINIAEVTANEIVNHKINKVALLGTKFTMEQPFFKQAYQL